LTGTRLIRLVAASISDIFVVGLSWRTAPVAVRETLAFREDELTAELHWMVQHLPICEVMMISTCNRVEIYGVTQHGHQAATVAAQLANQLIARRQAPADAAAALYQHAGQAAAEHVFRVAAALDSLVLGEAQILGQLKQSFQIASRAGTIGPLISRCLERAFGTAKRIRTQTAIARGAANVSTVAVGLARHVFGELSGKSVLVVGAGKMSRLAAKHLVTAGASQIVVTNRSMDKAEALAAAIGGIARPWEDLKNLLVDADVVISSTGARAPVLTHELFKLVTKQRRWRPLMIVDIAVPRDAEARIADFDGVYLFDIDDLQKVVDSNLSERAKASEAAMRIVNSETAAFEQWLGGQQVVPTIRALREHVTGVVQIETTKILEQLAKREHSPQERADALGRLAQLIANKLLHAPTTALKQASTELGKQRAECIASVFGLQVAASSIATDDEPVLIDESQDDDIESTSAPRGRKEASGT
jgi:glutamyl-tRNA reductase